VSLALVALANGILLYGLFALGWAPATIALLFWYEAAVIGASTFAKVVASLPGEAPGTKPSVAYQRLPRPGGRTRVRSSVPRMEGYGAPFKFLIGYGLVLLAYGALLMLALNGPHLGALVRDAAASKGVLLAAALIAAEHLWAFRRDYLRGPDWQRRDPTFHFWKPFGLAFRAYFAFFLGFLLLGWLQSPLTILSALIVLKAFAELLDALVDAQAQAWQRVDEEAA
jgi:hypothetical protein